MPHIHRRVAAASSIYHPAGRQPVGEAADGPGAYGIVNDSDRDGERSVRLTATATAWVPATATLAIANNERQQLVGVRVNTGGGCALSGTAGAPPADLSGWLVLALCAAAYPGWRRRRRHRPPTGAGRRRVA